MPLYTFVTDKQGGTYIEQFSAADIDAAVRMWHDRSHTMPGPGDAEDLDPTLIKGMKKVWCIDGFDPAGVFYIVHIVETIE